MPAILIKKQLFLLYPRSCQFSGGRLRNTDRVTSRFEAGSDHQELTRPGPIEKTTICNVGERTVRVTASGRPGST